MSVFFFSQALLVVRQACASQARALVALSGRCELLTIGIGRCAVEAFGAPIEAHKLGIRSLFRELKLPRNTNSGGKSDISVRKRLVQDRFYDITSCKVYYYGAGAVFNWMHQDFYTFRDSDTALQRQILR